MCVAQFLFCLPPSFDPVKSQTLTSKELPTLSDVFTRLRQASLSNSNTSLTTHSSDRYGLVTAVGSWGNKGRGGCSNKGHGGCNHGEGQGRGKEPPHK